MTATMTVPPRASGASAVQADEAEPMDVECSVPPRLSEEDYAREIILAAYHRDAARVASVLRLCGPKATAEMSLSRAAAVQLLGEDVYLGSHSWSTQEGFPVMYFAAKWGGAEVTRVLLESGARVAQSTTLGVQPLHMAAQEGQVGVARLLLQHGAPAGATDRAGWSAFHYAANHRWATWVGDVSGQLEVLELLAAAGADVNAGDSEGYTCAHSAAQSGKTEILRLLKRLGASPDAKTARGVMPVHVAAEGGRADAVDELVRWSPGALDAEDFRGHQPIHHAAYHGHVDVVEVLLRHGAEVQPGRRKKRANPEGGAPGDVDHDEGSPSGSNRDKERHGTTPLHLAVRSGSVGVVAALLAGGADPRRRDSHGWTPRGLLQECAARKAPGSPATPVNAMRDDDRAREYAAMDAVLRRAEMGVPLVWSRAAHGFYPREFKRLTRELVLAAGVPMGRADVPTLAADTVIDACVRDAARGVWPEVTERNLWDVVERVRCTAEARWAESCLRGIRAGGGERRARRLSGDVVRYDPRWGVTLGWFGVGGVVSGDGNPNHMAHHHHHHHTGGACSPPGSNALASVGVGGVGGYGLAKDALRLFGGHATLDEEGEEEVESAPPPHLVHLQQQYHQTAFSMAVYHHLQRASAAALAA